VQYKHAAATLYGSVTGHPVATRPFVASRVARPSPTTTMPSSPADTGCDPP
jgi:hypothetical protein